MLLLRDRLVGSVRCIASAESGGSGLCVTAPADAALATSGLGVTAPIGAAPRWLSGLPGLSLLCGLAVTDAARGGGHGAGLGPAFLLSSTADGSCGTAAWGSWPTSRPLLSPCAASAATDAVPTQVLTVSSAREASTHAGTVIAAILRIMARGARGSISHIAQRFYRCEYVC